MPRQTIIELPDYKIGSDRKKLNEIFITRPTDEWIKHLCFIECYGKNGTLSTIKYYGGLSKNAPKKPKDESYVLKLRHNQTANIRIKECTNMDDLLETLLQCMSMSADDNMPTDDDGFIIMKKTEIYHRKMSYIKGEVSGNHVYNVRMNNTRPSYFADFHVYANNIVENDEEVIAVVNALSLWGPRVNVRYQANRPYHRACPSGVNMRKLFGIEHIGEITDLFDELEIPNLIYGPFMERLSDTIKKKKPKDSKLPADRKFVDTHYWYGDV